MLYITHVEKVYETEQSHKSVKAQVAVRVVLQKIESNHHTMIKSWNSKTSKCLICYLSFHKNAKLKNMLKKFMRLNKHTKVQKPKL